MNATREQIVALLRENLSNSEISRRLRCDRHRVGEIRREVGIPNLPAQPLTLEQKWATLVRPREGGHLEWTGERQSTSGTPVMRYREKSYSPAAIAFGMQHDREPVGKVFAECDDFPHCVAPSHVDDETGRKQVREQLRYLTGRGERKPTCGHGHDQAVHGRYERDGRSYCGVCKSEQRAGAA
ncbi:hypothetical protein ACWGI0_23060 [Streptomyces sp. NPDC054802]